VTHYRTDNRWTIEIRSVSLLQSFQIASGVHRASCSIGTEGCFSWRTAAKPLTSPFTVFGAEIRNECCLLQCLMAFLRRDALVQLVEALRYKPERRGFCSRCCLILTQPGIFSEEQRRSGRRADKLATFICRLSRKMGALNSWNSKGCNRPVQGWFLPFYL